MRKVLETILAAYARWALALHKPQIVGITGSVGKSSAKDAISLVLSQKFSVGATAGNFNSQIGLPLAVLGIKKSGGFKKNLASVFGWLWIIISAPFGILKRDFPKILVLEMGTDHPGDITGLLNITGPLSSAVLTDIGISHMEFFPSREALAKEKLSILKGLKNSGIAILNADNSKVLEGKSKVPNTLTYGFGPADVQAHNFHYTVRDGRPGIVFFVQTAKDSREFFIPNAVGKPAAYAALGATAVGLSFGLDLQEVAKALENYHQPAGRLQIISGANGSTIIDDTYNASPSSVIAALEALSEVSSTRQLVSLGHMAELGSESESGHRQVADKLAAMKPDIIFLVGEKTKTIESELKNRQFAGQVFWFPDSDAAKISVKQNLLAGDWILVKGSQSARMEKIVKAIMRNPLDAPKLLVRQSKQWQR
ncbi:MAG TPA: UDP-N-acetylmuramoyl-tripeptide--D-alanyl-D-alanine ligase [Patescibacteria group bacterium]|nr:UDP-N-acetylmuramoyl-tripeptide--D-alanyl-D-alanine ligase [Patescibacteria group bacterium]